LAAYGWRDDRSVEEGLFEEGHRFDFFQAVRLLESAFPERSEPGVGIDPGSEVVRFRSNVGFGFPAADVEKVDRPGEEDEPAAMLVNFLGLAGGLGPLPRWVTELILERRNRKDTALKDFLDIFNHRLVSILYRARKKYRTALHWRSPEESATTRPFFGLVGLGTEGLENRMGVRDRSLLLYTGLLSRAAKSMVGLVAVLEHYFGCQVELAPFRGRWFDLADDQRTFIGLSGQNQELGRGVVLGTRVWDQTASFELTLGPLGLDRFMEFLPIGAEHRPLRALTEFYVGQDFLFDVRLCIAADEVPVSRLGGDRAARLGWTSWLKTTDFGENDSQVVLRHRE
jgi:type VI secretion system protein ImpH